MLNDLFCDKIFQIYKGQDINKIEDKKYIAALPFPIFKKDSWNLDFLEMDWYNYVQKKGFCNKNTFLEIFERSNDLEILNRIITLYSIYDEEYFDKVKLFEKN